MIDSCFPKRFQNTSVQNNSEIVITVNWTIEDAPEGMVNTNLMYFLHTIANIIPLVLIHLR